MLNCAGMNVKVFYLVLGVLLFSYVPLTVHAASTARAVVYSPSLCPTCPSYQYIHELQTALHEAGVMDIWVRSLDRPEVRGELDDLYQNLGVPESMHGIFVVSIDGKFLFINYVPLEIVTDFWANHTEEYQKIVVFRDLLRELYVVMDEEGQIRECNIERSVTECVVKQDVTPLPLNSILTLIVVSGLLDGINPCAFAVLIFFIAFLMIMSKVSFERTRRRVLELVKDRVQKTPDPEAANRTRDEMREKGVLIGVGGIKKCTLRLQPCLTVTRKQMDKVLETLEETFKKVGTH